MLTDKELYCLSKYIQECAGISLSCTTCKYFKECCKENFKFQLETLLKIEKTTELCLRSPSKINTTINITINNSEEIAKDIAEKINLSISRMDRQQC